MPPYKQKEDYAVRSDIMIYTIYVKTNARKFNVYIKDGNIFVELKSSPIEGKANIELIKNFKKYLKCNVKIVKGLTSKKKIINADCDLLDNILKFCFKK